MSARIAMAAARGILLSWTKLAEFGGHVELNWHWAYSLMSRMKFVKRKVTTAKSKHSIMCFTQLKEAFLGDVVAMVKITSCPPSFPHFLEIQLDLPIQIFPKKNRPPVTSPSSSAALFSFFPSKYAFLMECTVVLPTW